MAESRVGPRTRRWGSGLLVGVALVAAVTGLAALLAPHTAELLGLPGLYLAAVITVSALWGAGPGAVVAGMSVVAFAFAFLARHQVLDVRYAVSLSVFLVAAVAIGLFAAQSQREAHTAARLSQEQAALRRVATLVAESAPPQDIFETVTHEVATVLRLDMAGLVRFEPGGIRTFLAGTGFRVGHRSGQQYDRVVSAVEPTSAIRVDDARRIAVPGWASGEGVVALVFCPITVGGRAWGALVGASRTGPLPAATEQQLVAFTELIGTAVASTQSRSEINSLLEQQAALRHVATLVARELPPAEIIPAVVDAIGEIVGADVALMTRLDPDGATTIIAQAGNHPPELAVGNRFELDPGLAMTEVLQTGRPARRESYFGLGERMGGVVERMGVRSGAAIPVMVGGRVWGALGVASSSPLPANIEDRMASFTELVEMAIRNADSRAELAASRGRIVTASDEARRRIERDLHDGAQQRLVSLGLELRTAQAALPESLPEARAVLGQVAGQLSAVLDDLRETARGIHPAALFEGGLRPALRTLARRASLPVELDVRTDARFPPSVEVAAYYVVSESLANAAKHGHASHVDVFLAEQEHRLLLTVRDDGVGGADPKLGSGLTGLRDRVEAIGGAIDVTSPPRGGTTVCVTLPRAVG